MKDTPMYTVLSKEIKRCQLLPGQQISFCRYQYIYKKNIIAVSTTQILTYC